jgi:hypothetical protein
VEVGVTLVEPLAELDVKLPGAMAIVVAPLADQFSVLLMPELRLVGLAVNEAMEGFVPLGPDDPVDAPPQPSNAAQSNRTNSSAERLAVENRDPKCSLFPRREFTTSIACPFKPAHAGYLLVFLEGISAGFVLVAHAGLSPFDRFR